jgi:hypothetical protein
VTTGKVIPAPYDPLLTKEERLRLFKQWADGHPKDSPFLTDEEISHDALYAGTGGDRIRTPSNASP